MPELRELQNRLLKRLEPDIPECAMFDVESCQFSMALSLKRIADAAERSAGILDTLHTMLVRGELKGLL